MKITFGSFSTLLPGLLEMSSNIAIAIIVLIIGFSIAKSSKKILKHSFERIEMEVSIGKFLLSLIYTTICGISVFIALERIGVSSASIIAILGSAGLALGLALQGSLSNFAGGILIVLMKPFKVGDYIICVDNGEGTVTVIGLVYTTLNTADNKSIIIPNGILSNATLINVSAQQCRRVDFLVRVDYQSDLFVAKGILYDIFTESDLVLKDREVQVFVHELAESAVVLGARGWVNAADYWTARWNIIETVKVEFDKANIKIPYRQMDVNVKQNPQSSLVVDLEENGEGIVVK